MVWDTASCQVNVCEGLDWKRSLALHLWYTCQPTAPIREVVGEFMQAFQVSSVVTVNKITAHFWLL